MSSDINELTHLLAAVAVRDRNAFRRLYQLTNRKLYGVALRILRNAPDADDALQDIFIKIWERASFYRAGTASPISWLATIARNQAIDLFRAKRPPMLDVALLIGLSDNNADAERTVLEQETRRLICASIDKLPAKSAELVRGAYVDELTYKELAQRHGVSLNTVRTQLRRGMATLSRPQRALTVEAASRRETVELAN